MSLQNLRLSPHTLLIISTDLQIATTKYFTVVDTHTCYITVSHFHSKIQASGQEVLSQQSTSSQPAPVIIQLFETKILPQLDTNVHRKYLLALKMTREKIVTCCCSLECHNIINYHGIFSCGEETCQHIPLEKETGNGHRKKHLQH